MDFFKAIQKAVNVAETVLKTAERLGDKEDKENEEKVGYVPKPNAPKQPKAEPTKPLEPSPDAALAAANEDIGPVHRISYKYGGKYLSYELPETFFEFDSGAEPWMCFSEHETEDGGVDLNMPVFYMDDTDIPYIAVKSFNKTGAPTEVISWERTAEAPMLFAAKAKAFGRIRYFYGFMNKDTETGLTVEYAASLAGTAEERRALSIFKHAGATFKITDEEIEE